MKTVEIYARLLRMQQWVKNVFIFMPLIFGGYLFNAADAAKVFGVFVTFCLLSSCVYIINDINDLKSDRFHPQKKHRPLAASEVTVAQALALAVILMAAALLAGFLIGPAMLFIMALYVLLHLAYTFSLKKTVILDVIAIACGFELRIWAGAVVLGFRPSIWIQLCVFVLALFLGFIKRRHEKRILYERAAEHRGVLMHYTAYFLDQMIMISATLCVVFYGLYVMSEDVIRRTGTVYMAYTIPFVVYGIFRYLYLVHVKKLGGDPGEILTSDAAFAVNILLWITAAVAILYAIK